MKIVTWTIGLEKPAGNLISDGLLHYNEPTQVQFGEQGGTSLEKNVNFTYNNCFDGSSHSDTCGFLDFTLSGGLTNGMKITCIWW